MALVTVVMPTYIRQDYLRAAIESLVAQDFKDFTALVCDNAQSDQTRDLVASFGDDRLVYLRRDHNLGLVGNTLTGFRAAETEFVTKLDDDDLFEPTFLSRTVGALQANPELAFAFSQMTWIGPDGEPLARMQAQQDESHGRAWLTEGIVRPLTTLLVHGVAALNATVLRTSAVDWNRITDDTATAFDLQILLEAARGGAGAWHCAEQLVRYRVHAGTDSSQNYARQLEGRAAALRHALVDAAPFDRPALSEALLTTATVLSRVHLQQGRSGPSRKEIGRVLRGGVRAEAVQLAAFGLLPTRLSQPVMQRRLRAWQRQQGMPGAD